MSIIVVGAILAFAAVAILLPLVSAWWKYRGNRLIQCPENHRSAAVVVDAARAAVTSFGHAPELRLSRCSRWPGKSGCGQECLSQIQAAGEECLMRNIIAKWYRGKTCAACGAALENVDWSGSPPCLLTEGGMTLEWKQLPADQWDRNLSSAKAICFACHTATTLVREHPELATDRHRAV